MHLRISEWVHRHDFISDYESGMTLSDLATKYNVTFDTVRSRARAYKLTKKVDNTKRDLKVIASYKKGVVISNIARDVGVTEGFIYDILNKHGIELTRINERGSEEDLLEIGATAYVCGEHGKRTGYYIKKCPSCGKDYKLKLNSANRLRKDGRIHQAVCLNCHHHTIIASNNIAKKKKGTNNTSGYIGVGIWNDRKGDGYAPRGYYMGLRYQNKTVAQNNYRDKELTNATLMQAVCDRELLIIEKDLPHRRNLTDIELKGWIERLGLMQLDNLTPSSLNAINRFSEAWLTKLSKN